MPALYHLYRAGELPRAFAIVGYASGEMTDDQYRDMVRDAHCGRDAVSAHDGARSGRVRQVDLLCLPGCGDHPLEGLKDRLAEIDAKVGAGGNYMFYLAIPPSAFMETADALGAAGLAKSDSGWRRLVIEKRLGPNLESARELQLRPAASF